MLLATKLTEKIPDPRNAKEHYQSYIRKKKHKINKTIKNNYSGNKNFKNSIYNDIKKVKVF